MIITAIMKADRMTIGEPRAVQNGSAGVSAPEDASLAKLRLVMALFRLRSCDLHATGFSKAYISGVLTGKIKASAQFWMKLNSVLPRIINDLGSACCVFEIERTDVPDLPEVIRQAS